MFHRHHFSEYIESERNNLELLKILQRSYAKGLIRELGMDKTTINKLFPNIDEHVALSSRLVEKLKERQSANKVLLLLLLVKLIDMSIKLTTNMIRTQIFTSQQRQTQFLCNP